MKFVLIRHPAVLIESGLCYGRLDVPAIPAALARAGSLATGLAHLAPLRISTSPARRCQDLANLLAQKLNAPAVTDPRLLELDFGAWEGKSWDVVPRSALDDWSASPLTFAPPGGETGSSLIARVRDFLGEIRLDRRNRIVVTHGGPLKVLTALLDGSPVDLLTAAPPVGSVRIFDVANTEDSA